MTSSPENEQPIAQPTMISGKLVIIVMFCFAALMTSMMWAYWKLNLAPFLPLQQAIIATDQFSESRPVVEGGRAKGQENAPNTLRVTMKIDFYPQEDPERIDLMVVDVIEIAKKSLPHYAEFDQMEFNVYWPKQETELKPLTDQRIVELKKSEN